MEKDLIGKDLKYVWHPFTQMQEHNPVLIERAKGVWLYDDKGNKYIDGISSWWVNTLGHSNERLNNALCEQANTMEHVIFSGFTHKNAVVLAEKLVELTVPKLTKVFYSDNGSTAVEVALKMAYQYQVHRGKSEKCKFVAFKNSYHGDTIGAVSVGGVDLYHKVYGPLLFEIFQGESPYCYRCPKGKDKDTCACECLDSTEDALKGGGFAGVIIEPIVQCAGGMIIYPPKHLRRLRELCDKYDTLLILDEVATGFYRTGKLFAHEHAGIEPDLMCIAKGITAGYMPLAVTMATDEIYEAFWDDWDKFKTFFHGHSYTANPLATRLAVENLKILEEENIKEVVKTKSEVLKSELERFKSLKYVGDVRSVGMIGAIELVEDKKTKQPFDPAKRVGMQVSKRCLELGALLRPLGDTIYFMPPYVISESELRQLIDTAYRAISEIVDS